MLPREGVLKTVEVFTDKETRLYGVPHQMGDRNPQFGGEGFPRPTSELGLASVGGNVAARDISNQILAFIDHLAGFSRRLGGAQALHDCRIARDQGIGDIHGFIGVLSSCGHAFGDVHSQKVPGCRIDGFLAIDWAQALRREAGDARRINARPPPTN